MKKNRTLVAGKRYLGVEAVALQHAAHRVLARVVGMPVERARVSVRQLRNDFNVDTETGDPLVARLVAGGLVKPRAERTGDFEVLPRMAEFAGARIVEPLARQKAKRLLERTCKLAERFNEETSRNPYAILAVAPCGEYVTNREKLSELRIGVVLCKRPAERVSRWRAPMSEDEGAAEIRAGIVAQSSFVKVILTDDVRTLPRPFSVAWQDPAL